MKKILKNIGDLIDTLIYPPPKASPLEQFVTEFPHLTITGEYDAERVLPQLYSFLKEVTIPVQNSVKIIQFISESKWAEHVEGVYGKGKKCGGYFLGKSEEIVFPEQQLTLRTISHELAHALDYRKEREHKKKGAISLSPRERWKTIQEKGYGEHLGPKTIGPGYANQWSNGSREPRNGFVMAYGANNEIEDLATCVEAAYTWTSETWAYLLVQDITRAFWVQVNLPEEKLLVFKNIHGTMTLLGKKRKPIPYTIALEKKKGLHNAILLQLSKDPSLCNLTSITEGYGGTLVNAWYDTRYRKKVEFLYQEEYIPERIYRKIIGL